MLHQHDQRLVQLAEIRLTWEERESSGEEDEKDREQVDREAEFAEAPRTEGDVLFFEAFDHQQDDRD